NVLRPASIQARLLSAEGRWAYTVSRRRVIPPRPFRYTPTRFGGHRQWLTCLKCRRRCRRIFGGHYFRCRQCHGLKYASQREDAGERAMQRADRIATRLHDRWKGTTKAEWEFPPKPARMRWRTYRRLEQQYEELQGRWTMGMVALLGRLQRVRKRSI